METNTINKLYPFGLWLTTIGIVAPALLTIYSLISDASYFKIVDDLAMIILFIGFGLVLSLPVFIICFISYNLLVRKSLSALLIKFSLSLVSIVGVFITFLIIRGSMAFELSLIYSASIIISSTFYKVYKQNKQLTTI